MGQHDVELVGDGPVVLAFSGGLDTSFCLVWLKQEIGREVVCVTVDTGGFDDEELAQIKARAEELGASEHLVVSAREDVWQDHVSYLIKGNTRRGQVYPLCVGAERITQAQIVAKLAAELGASALAHGSTGAGNDQIRFDVAFQTLCPQLPVLTPVRDGGWTREAVTSWLRERGVHVEDKTTTYSVNAGLWGVTIGGGSTHQSWEAPPEEAWAWTCDPQKAPASGQELILDFTQGLPTALDGEALSGVALVEKLNALGASHGIGRGVHMGDTILGIKGRVLFEAPAAAILLDAHRELEKLVLTRWQQTIKAQLADLYGAMLHEAQSFDPAARDLEALIDSTQKTVTGQVRLRLCQGRVDVLGVRSPYSLMDAQGGAYGERTGGWTGADARGFAKLYGMQSALAAAATKKAGGAQ